MFDASTDPLGIGVQQRARDLRLQQTIDAIQHGGSAPTMLTDPKWDGYFEATQEAGGGKPVGFGYAAGTPISTGADGATYAGEQDLSRDPNYLTQTNAAMPMATWGNAPSQQLGTAVRLRQSLSGLRGVA